MVAYLFASFAESLIGQGVVTLVKRIVPNDCFDADTWLRSLGYLSLAQIEKLKEREARGIVLARASEDDSVNAVAQYIELLGDDASEAIKS